MEHHSGSSSEKSSISPSNHSSSLCPNHECSELRLPPHWFHKHSRSQKGKVYFANSLLKKVSWELPLFNPCEANCHKCKTYAKNVKKSSTLNTKALKNYADSSSFRKNTKTKQSNTFLGKKESENHNGDSASDSKVFDKKSFDLNFRNFNHLKSFESKKPLTNDECTENDSKSIHLRSNIGNVCNSARKTFWKQSFQVRNCVKLPKSLQLHPFENDAPFSTTSASSQTHLAQSQLSNRICLPSALGNKAKSNVNRLFIRKSFSNLKEKVFGASLVRPICLSRRKSYVKKRGLTNTGYRVVAIRSVKSSQNGTYQSRDTNSFKRSKKVHMDEKLYKKKKIKFDCEVQVLSTAEVLHPSDIKCQASVYSAHSEKLHTLSPALEICASEFMDVDCNSAKCDMQAKEQIHSHLSDSACIINNSNSQLKNLTIWVVIDTNLLVHELSLVKSLSYGGVHYKKYQNMMLVIPHTVIRELDLLKKDSKCQIEAQFAVKWINRMLEQSVCAAADENFVNGAHNVCGQSLKNYNELRDSTDDKCLDSLLSQNGDDRILDYCLWLKQRGLKVLLLSNDINFRNKAIFAEVPSVGSKNLKEDLTWADELSAAVHLDQSFKVQCHQRSSSSPNLENGMQSQSVVHSEHADASDVHMNDISLNNFVNENTNGTNHLSTSNSKLPNTSSVSEKTASSCNPSSKSVCSSLRMTLSNILTERMKSVFSDLWLSIVIRKPPWNLHDLFVCWKKHWVAVFTDIFPSELQTDLKLFQRMLRFKSSEEELYQQMCKIYGSLSTENFRDLIVYPQKDSIEGKLNKSFSNNPEVLDANLSIVTHPVDQNSNNISTTNTTILAYNSKQESLSEIHSPVSQLSSSGISNHCLSTNVLQIHPLQTSSYQSPSFSNDDSTWRNTHGKTDETSINKSCHLDGTSLCWDQDFVDARTVADAHKAFIATGEKMRALVCEGLSSISRAEGPYRTEVLASLLNLKLCISTFRAALTRCHDDPSAASNFHHLRSAIVEFWENVHEERNSSAQVFNSMTGAVAASALFRSKEEGFWLTCLKHLWEMETALNAELPVESQLQ